VKYAYQEPPHPENTASPSSRNVDRKREHGFIRAQISKTTPQTINEKVGLLEYRPGTQTTLNTISKVGSMGYSIKRENGFLRRLTSNKTPRIINKNENIWGHRLGTRNILNTVLIFMGYAIKRYAQNSVNENQDRVRGLISVPLLLPCSQHIM
jgi:ribosomal protein L34